MSKLQLQAFEYSCLLAPLPKELSDTIIAWGNANIPEEDIYTDDGDKGREDYIHATVKFGLHTTDIREVRTLLDGTKPIKVKLGKVSLFRNEGSPFDVVKIEVDSPDLHQLNNKVSSNLENTDEFPKYVPHVTIAYVQRGRGNSLVHDTSFVKSEFTVDTLDFSNPEGDKNSLKLQANASLLADPSIIKYFESRGISRSLYLEFIQDIEVIYTNLITNEGEAEYTYSDDPSDTSRQMHLPGAWEDLNQLPPGKAAVLIHELEHSLQTYVLNQQLSDEDFEPVYEDRIHELGAIASEAAYLLQQGYSREQVIEHIMSLPREPSITRSKAKMILNVAEDIDPQSVLTRASQSSGTPPTNSVYLMAMICSLATGCSFVEATQQLFTNAEDLIQRTTEARSRDCDCRDIHLEEDYIDMLGGWENFCRLVQDKLDHLHGHVQRTASTYTDKEMEEYYTEQHEYESSTGGGNVYHDWNHDSSDYPKPKDLDRPHTRLDQLVPVWRRFQNWIVPPRGNPTDFIIAPAASLTPDAPQKTAAEPDSNVWTNVTMDEVSPDLSHITGHVIVTVSRKKAVTTERMTWTATLQPSATGAKVYQIDMADIENTLMKSRKIPVKFKRRTAAFLRSKIQHTIQTEVMLTRRKVPSPSDLEGMFGKLPHIWWSKTNSMRLKPQYVQDMLLRNGFDPTYFETFSTGEAGTYTWDIIGSTLLLTRN